MLQFRGFTATFRALESEIRTDKDKGFQVIVAKFITLGRHLI